MTDLETLPATINVPTRYSFRRTATDPRLDAVLVGAIRVDHGSWEHVKPSPDGSALVLTGDRLVVVDAEVWDAQTPEARAGAIRYVLSGADVTERWPLSAKGVQAWDPERFFSMHCESREVMWRKLPAVEPRNRSEAVAAEAWAMVGGLGHGSLARVTDVRPLEHLSPGDVVRLLERGVNGKTWLVQNVTSDEREWVEVDQLEAHVAEGPAEAVEGPAGGKRLGVGLMLGGLARFVAVRLTYTDGESVSEFCQGDLVRLRGVSLGSVEAFDQWEIERERDGATARDVPAHMLVAEGDEVKACAINEEPVVIAGDPPHGREVEPPVTFGELQEALDRVKRWQAEAQRYAASADHYRTILEKTATHLGPDVLTDDHGQRAADPFVFKIPDLVQRLADEAKGAAQAKADLQNVHRSAKIHKSERERAELEAENARADLRVAMREIEELRALVVRQALALASRGCP